MGSGKPLWNDLSVISIKCFVKHLGAQSRGLFFLCCFPFCFPVGLPYCIPRCTTPSLGRSSRWKNDDLGLVPIFKKKYFTKICDFIFSDRYAQILTFHYVTHAAFPSFQTIKVTFLILHHFPVIGLPLCLPVVLPRGGDPNATSRLPQTRASARA